MMTPETFLAATADDGWLTIDQLVAKLDAANYWYWPPRHQISGSMSRG